MATRRSAAKKASANNVNDQIPGHIRLLQNRIDELDEFDPFSVNEQGSSEKRNLNIGISDTLSKLFGQNTPKYQRFFAGAQLYDGPHNFAQKVPPRGWQNNLEKSKKGAMDCLKTAIRSLEETRDNLMPAADKAEAVDNGNSNSNRIFIVHGHDGEVKSTVARFLEQLKLEAVILHEKANKGQTLIEKFERNADVGFAVVLLTPDDVGGSVDGDQKPRARQNVILELGYFIGKLGRDRVCAIKSGELEMPSDVLNVAFTEFDAAGGWQFELIRELKSAGYSVDSNVIF